MFPFPSHRLRSLLLILLGSLFSLQAAQAAAERPARPETLDHKTIHEKYNDGDFESVIKALEAFMAGNRSYSLTDSVFIAKHLAVVYTADPATREKGKYYMHRLLELLPSAKLVDMYVSDEIDRIFDKVREEFLARQRGYSVDTVRAAQLAAPPGRQAPSPEPSPKRERAGKGKAGFWIAGGVAVALAGGTVAYFIHQNESDPAPSHWNVPDSSPGK